MNYSRNAFPFHLTIHLKLCSFKPVHPFKQDKKKSCHGNGCPAAVKVMVD